MVAASFIGLFSFLITFSPPRVNVRGDKTRRGLRCVQWPRRQDRYSYTPVKKIFGPGREIVLVSMLYTPFKSINARKDGAGGWCSKKAHSWKSQHPCILTVIILLSVLSATVSKLNTISGKVGRCRL